MQLEADDQADQPDLLLDFGPQRLQLSILNFSEGHPTFITSHPRLYLVHRLLSYLFYIIPLAHTQTPISSTSFTTPTPL